MIAPYLDITEVSYLSEKLFRMLLVKENNIYVADFKKHNINALSLVEQGLNIKEKWMSKVSSEIEGLRLNSYTYPSLVDISKFSKLEYFQLIGMVSNGEIPFTELDKLKEVDLNYQDKTCKQIFDQQSVEYLDLSYYKSRSGTELTRLKNLKQLNLNHAVFPNLEFLSDMREMKKLSISYNPKLTRIEQLGATKETLKSFGVQNCKKIRDWHVLQEMKQLEFIYIENCGEIETLEFLNELPNLRGLYIIGTTKVLDGKLKKIINKESVEKINIAIGKNYDITRDDVRKFDFIPAIKVN
ncbi:hypothetical protein D0817_05375 [Flavobacterium cupreum]|uniref:Leucine-rich repeat domain-containing protein n=1 Tax=Flavobacterium cupreum TaxID=2133766 RepID=A0A434AAC9_9FLAO|nr:hypothetical protein [Flavobacterium cupreum]RUT71307.1 hypothetical protein D0817_05375 [Flavobacterium cupreum]